MKKIVIIFLLVGILSPSFGQGHKRYSSRNSTVKWLSIAPRAGYGGGLLLNSAVFSDPRIAGEKRSPASYIGGRFGFTHGDNIGLSFVGGKSSFTQNYSAYDINTIDSYTKAYEFTALEYGVLLRYTSDLGFIFEIGPRKVSLKTAQSIVSGNNLIEAQDISIIDTMLQSYTSVNIMLGQSLVRTDRTELNVGLKINYGLKDLFNEDYPFVQDNYYNASNPDFYDKYVNTFHESTNPLTLMLTFEFNYFFAFWGDASCGRGRFMMFQ